MRAACTDALLERRARRAAGGDVEESAEAEAGALLEAETANELHGIHAMIASYIEALNNSRRG